MSETVTDQQAQPTTGFRTPEQEQAAKGAGIPGAYDMPIEDINPLNAHIFKDNRWREYFERLRAEDPVHFNQIETAIGQIKANFNVFVLLHKAGNHRRKILSTERRRRGNVQGSAKGTLGFHQFGFKVVKILE